MHINIITLGCSKNTVDSENLAAQLSAIGHTVHFDRQRNDSETTIINTCGFIGDAKEQSIHTILQQIAVKTRGRKPRRLIVCGCLAERYRNELAAEMPEVDAWYGVHQWNNIIHHIGPANNNTPATKNNQNPLTRPLSTPRHYAYLKIAEGCNRSCSYCAIPLIRGPHLSRPIDDIVDEAKRLVDTGVKELLVISQDTTYYGLDLYKKRILGTLLQRLANESGAPWIRLHYTYPSSFPIDAIETIAQHKNICNYIDIPLQHINSQILSSMQRGINREATLQLIQRFRSLIPDLAIRTTLIVGYPGESEKEFSELLDFVRFAQFDRLGCFAYSPEDGTPAFRLGDPVDNQTKQLRISQLMELQEQISLEKNHQRIGHSFRCLIDRIEPDNIIARTEYDSPEVDNEVIIPRSHGRTPKPGDFANIRITSALEHDLIGQLE